MKLNINTTDKQDEFNTRAFTDANTNRAESKLEPFTLETWYQQEFSDKADAYVNQFQQRDLEAVHQKLLIVTAKLTPQDLAQVLAVAEKYAQ